MNSKFFYYIFQGKTALVTGASSGIGAAICKKMAAAGMTVIGVARRKERIEVTSFAYDLCIHVSKEADVLLYYLLYCYFDTCNTYYIERSRCFVVGILIRVYMHRKKFVIY